MAAPGVSPEQAAAMAAGIQAFKNVQGPLQIGVQVSLILLGIVTCQLSTYLRQYFKKDSWYTKSFVLCVYLTLVLKAALDMATTYQTYILPWGTPGSPYLLDSTAAGIIVACVTLALCQLWLVHRVYVVSKKALLATILGLLLALASTALQVTYAVLRVQKRDVRDPSFRGDVFLRSWAWTSMATQIYLCAAFAFYALRQMKTAMSARLDSVLRSLTRLAVQSCLPTASIAFATAVAQDVRPHHGEFIAFQLVLPALYVFSVLYTLNARHRIAEEAKTATGEGEGASNFKSSYFSPAQSTTEPFSSYRSRMGSWASTFTRRDSAVPEPTKEGIACTVDVSQRVERVMSLDTVAENDGSKAGGVEAPTKPEQPHRVKAHLWHRWEHPTNASDQV